MSEEELVAAARRYALEGRDDGVIDPATMELRFVDDDVVCVPPGLFHRAIAGIEEEAWEERRMNRLLKGETVDFRLSPIDLPS